MDKSIRRKFRKLFSGTKHKGLVPIKGTFTVKVSGKVVSSVDEIPPNLNKRKVEFI
jgi:hypothetical protein